MALSMEYVKYQPEHNPQTIINYCSNGVQSGRSKNQDVKDLILKAKKHLSAIGWSFFYIYKHQHRRELRYRSPAGRLYYSLRTACQSLVDQYGRYIHVLEEKPKESDVKTDKKDDLFSDNRPKKKIRMEDVESSYFEQQKEQFLVDDDTCIVENQHIEGIMLQEVKRVMKSRHSMFGKPKEIVKKVDKGNDSLSDNRPKKQIRMEDVENSYFQQQRDQSFVKDEPDIDENNGIEGNSKGIDVKRSMISIKKKNDFKPMKVIRKADKGSGSSTRRRCMLSLLIEKNILTKGSRVFYRKKDGRILAKGRVFDEGIQCDCCDQFFLLSKFEAHAGSTYHRPAANIFLEDGRSIFDCQNTLQQENKVLPMIRSTQSGDSVTGNVDFCSFCYDGGELVLCDSCTSSFHSTCIGLTRIPDSDYWFCPSCCCRICHEASNDDAQIKCAQCDRKFHINCVKNLGFAVSNANCDKWLCSESCERIYASLKAISGKTIPLTVDNSLSWRLLKLDEGENDTYECTDTHIRLNIALDVMHESFQPIKHHQSENDLLEDLIFSRSSNGSNFTGFFTAVLERNDEMITVAALRIHGSKAAEIPLIATRSRHRRLGMCRILIDEIERKMRELGIERLVLPAVPEMISTWTESFGFSLMPEIERLSHVEYKFLDFPGTIMCHKMLK